MKKLFKQCDTITSPVVGKLETIEVPTFYNAINYITTNEKYRANSIPFDRTDLTLLRESIVGLFRNRVEFLLTQSLSKVVYNLKKLENKLNANKYNHYLNLDPKVINKIEERIPYLFDLMFYFEVDIENYESKNIIAMNIASIVFNSITVEILDNNVDNNDVNDIFISINNILFIFQESIIDDIRLLCNEVKQVYFPLGDHDKYILEDGNQF